MEKKRIREIGLYLVFGVLTTLVSWGSYTAFVRLLHCSVFLANLLSWLLAVLFAYVTNKLWVFESKSLKARVIGREMVTFFLSRGVTGALEIACVPLLERAGYDGIFFGILKSLGIGVKLLYTAGIYSKITVSAVIVILNYFFSKLIVFKKKAEDSD